MTWISLDSAAALKAWQTRSRNAGTRTRDVAHATKDTVRVRSDTTPREARAFLSEMAHIFNAIFSALQQRESAYASVLGALLELSGEKAQAVKVVPDEAIDTSWEEPVVFGGCSVKGQATPGQAQPIHFVKNDAARANAKAANAGVTA